MKNPPEKPANKFKSVQSLMQIRGSGFGQLLDHARVLGSLDKILTSTLDTTLSPHCQVADYRHHCLTLTCSNATFATRLRMITPQLLESFREEGAPGIERMEIRIAPVNRPQPEVRQQRNLSSAAVQALGRFAADSGDADIQAIFDKIKARRNR